MTPLAARDRLIVALDFASVDEARALVAKVGDACGFYKVGLELVMRGGLDLVRDLKSEGYKVFLDMKYLDIPNTVEKSVAGAAATGADLVTIHGIDAKTVAAAARGAAGSDLKVLGVTVLTSLDAADLAQQGIDASPAGLVVRRAEIVAASGGHGVVASGHEAGAVRAAIGLDRLIVTPGIRLPDNSADDQARVATPRSAISAGASHLVVGRPITQASDPRAAAQLFVAEIEAALG